MTLDQRTARPSAFAYVSPSELRARHRKLALAVVGSKTSEEAARRIEPYLAHLERVVYEAISKSGALSDEDGIFVTGLSPLVCALCVRGLWVSGHSHPWDGSFG